MSAAERVKGSAMEQECKYLRDRIEQLERELSEQSQRWDFDKLMAELAAEKALADRFGLAMHVSNSELQAALIAWRKARGL